MAENSENERSYISLSSDNFSPKKTMSSKSFKLDECSNIRWPHSIVISDTELEELEEGEISDEDIAINKECKKDIAKEPLVEKSLDPKVEKCVDLEVVLDTNSDVDSSKRKLAEEFFSQLSKKEKLSDVCEATESFPWSDLRVLIVGDERTLNFTWQEWAEFPEQELFHVNHCSLEAVCSLAEKHLFKEYDVVLLLAFHYDFVCVNNADKNDPDNKFVLDLKTGVNIVEILKTVNKFHTKWERQYPNTYIIWTLPSPPDFFKYNSFALKEQNIDPDERIDRHSQNELSKNYYSLTKKFLKEWKINNKSIPIFPLSKVLFIKKHCYKKSFEGRGSPKFPRGFLSNGLYPTKMMAMYCAYLLVEFLLDYQFYPENKHGIDMKSAEAKLTEIYPIFKCDIHNSEKPNIHSRRRHKHSSRRHHSHRSHKREDSLSPRSSSHRSRSRSHSKRRRSVSSSRTRRKSGQKHKRSPRSRTRSTSKNRHRKTHSRSRRRSKMSFEQSHPRSHSRSESASNSSHTSSISSRSASVNNKVAKSASVETKVEGASEDEVAFFKTLKYLREVHEIQCTVFRRKPPSHPMYKDEKEKFLKRLNDKLPLEFKLPKWEEYWKKRMESIFEQTWAVKKDQLTADLNKKIGFSSLHGYVQNDEAKEMLATSTPNASDRRQFKQENVETISSYLKELEGSMKLDSSISQPSSRSDSKDFTLADIFKDSSSNKQETRNWNDNESHHEDTSKSYPSPSVKTDHEIRDSQLETRENSGENGYFSSDSDLDVDGLMENPEFLQGLDEIDKELQKVAAASITTTEPTIATNAVEPLSVPVTSASSSGAAAPATVKNTVTPICKNTQSGSVSSEEDLKSEFVNVLKMLFRVSKRLGPLGLSVSALYHRASEDFSASFNSDSKSLLILVDKKLNHLLKESLPQVQKAIYGEIAERLQGLLKKINIEHHDRFSKVNVHSIAAATVGQQLSDVVSFIKNTLLYHGYAQFTTDDVMNIYMSVKAAQLDMEKS